MTEEIKISVCKKSLFQSLQSSVEQSSHSSIQKSRKLPGVLSLSTEPKPAILCTKCHFSIFPSLPPWLQGTACSALKLLKQREMGTEVGSEDVILFSSYPQPGHPPSLRFWMHVPKSIKEEQDPYY